jgi:hypothetical protein
MPVLKSAGFVVDESSDEKLAKDVLKDLRRMAKLGRMAERALRGIEADGFYTGFAPVATLPSDARYGGYSNHNETKKSSTVRFVRLHKRLPISRADLGPMDKLYIQMGKVNDTKYAGNDTREIPLLICGPMMTQKVSGEAGCELEDDERECGHIRINKNHLSWLAPAAYGPGDAWRVYKEMKYSGARESMTAFAKGVSSILVKKERSQEFLASAKMLDLQANAWEWFLADGHAERMFRDIHELTRVIEVMDS